jgi:hypothetical protein
VAGKNGHECKQSGSTWRNISEIEAKVGNCHENTLAITLMTNEIEVDLAP